MATTKELQERPTDLLSGKPITCFAFWITATFDNLEDCDNEVLFFEPLYAYLNQLASNILKC